MKKYKVGVIGATGMVGQRFLSLLENHPWFEVVCLAASSRSAGKRYADAVKSWNMPSPMPAKFADMILSDAVADREKIAAAADFCFCAVNMNKDEIKRLEYDYAAAECPIVSNNSAHRGTEDVPMVIPEINAEHLKVIESQKKRLGTKRGFIAVKSNCSLQSYVPLLHPLMKFGVQYAAVTTYQAISGAGKTFETMPEIRDNVIPYIGGEEEKSELEPLKIWGSPGRENRTRLRPRRHRSVFKSSRLRRSHRGGIRKIRKKALPRRNSRRLGKLLGRTSAARTAVRTRTVYPLFRGKRPTSACARQNDRERNGDLCRQIARGRAVRL